MVALYELTASYRHLETLADSDAPDDELTALLDQIDGAIRDKAENLAMVIRNAEATADAIREEEKRMAARRKAIESRVGNLKRYLLTNMVALGVSQVECPKFRIAVRENPPSVVIDDPQAIPAEYLRQPPPEPDKAKLADDLKQGVVLECAHLERGKRLEIK